jgi:hypothetical protein
MAGNEQAIPKRTGGSLARITARWLKRPATYVIMGASILALDLVTGPFLLFPILFILPVSLSAWFFSSRWAYALALILPMGRFFIADYVDHPSPPIYSVANALIRIAVLMFMSFLIARTARQTRELREKWSGLVTVCAWSRTIEYQGQWISFEEYLRRRFNIETSHGISPAEAKRLLPQLKSDDRNV